MPVLRPTLDIIVERGDLSWGVRALIDTGAPHTMFDRGTADMLDIDFDSGTRREQFNLLGAPREAQVEEVTLMLPDFPDLSWKTEVSFLEDDLNLTWGGFLGTRGFLDRWVVTFHRAEEYFVVEEPESFKARLPPEVAEEYERRDSGYRGP